LNFPEKGDEGMNPEADETAWLKKMRRKIEEEMAHKEIEVILYWKREMERILARRHESLGTLQIEAKKFVERMQNRIRILKDSLPE
jgi:hypothetical protein